MYRYIIVDDEALIRKGLISKVDSITSEKFQCAGEASNGLQGLELIEKTDPDIIITDMKMKRMSGVEFLEIIGDKYPEKPVIVISGYQDFNYVKKAMEKRVIGYVVKPFSVEEIEKQLLDAAARIRQRQDILQLKKRVDTLEKKKGQEALLSAILEPWDESRSQSPGKSYLLVTAYIEEKGQLEKIQQICQEHLTYTDYSCMENPLYKRQYFILLETESRYREKLPILGEKLCLRLQEGLEKGKVFLCISGILDSMEALNRSYKRSEKRVRDIRLGERIVLLHTEEPGISEKEIYEEEEISRIFRELKYRKEGKKRVLEAFFDHMESESHSLGAIGQVCGSLLEKVNEYAKRENVDTDDIMGVFYHRYLFCRDIEKMKSEISGYIILVLNSIELYETNQEHTLSQMEEYIRANYHKKLTLQMISSHFFLTPAYCSSMLKERLGKSFNEYISELRIKKAKELLEETDFSVENISEEVGYSNPKYFFKIFKKEVRCTPMEYRNEKRRGKA